MVRTICFYIFLFFCLILNIVLDFNVKNYIDIIYLCFGETINLTLKSYLFICFINALISVLIIIDIILVFYKRKGENKGIKIKSEDGTFGTANWMQEDEIKQVLGINEIPGIILGKSNGNIIKLPFDSFFNKNICVFGSSGSMKTIRFFTYKPTRAFSE